MPSNTDIQDPEMLQTRGWGWWPPPFASAIEYEWMFHNNRLKRSYDLLVQASTVLVHVGMIANAIGSPARTSQQLVYFAFAAVRTTLTISLIYRASPWFLHHRSLVFAVSQVTTALMYFSHVLRVPQMLMDPSAAVEVPNRLPAGGTLDRARFLLLLPMLQLHFGISGIASVRAKQLALIVTLVCGLVAAVARCQEEAANSPSSGPEYAKMVGAAEAALAPWLPAAVPHPREELSGAAACVAVNAGVQIGFGYAAPMAVMLIEETIARHSFAAHARAAEICLRPSTPTLVVFYVTSAILETVLCFSAVVATLRLFHSLGVTVFSKFFQMPLI